MEKIKSMKGLRELINLRESSSLEFKEGLNDIKEETCSFLNLYGGRILIGVKDNGEIKGYSMKNENIEISRIQDSFNSIKPKTFGIEIYFVENVLVIDIPKGIEKPYYVSGKCYIREGKNKQLLKSQKEVANYFNLNNKRKNFDEEINKRFNIDEDFNFKMLNTFINLTNINVDRKKSKNGGEQVMYNPKKILESRNFMKEGVFNNCSVLFFCKNIEKYFLNCSVDCILYKGEDKEKILDRKILKKSLLENFEDSISYLEQKLNLEYLIEDIYRREKLEIPIIALREILLNAFGHRDYFNNSNIFIEIYDNKVEITSPGSLNIDIDIKNYKDLEKIHSKPRNLLIFNKFLEMNLVEKSGSGFTRIRKSLEKENLKFDFENEKEYFKFIIYKKSNLNIKKNKNGTVNGIVNGTVNGTVNSKKDKKNKILKILKVNKNLNSKKIMELTNLKERTLKRYLKELIEENLIEFVGSDKTGGYYLK